MNAGRTDSDVLLLLIKAQMTAVVVTGIKQSTIG